MFDLFKQSISSHRLEGLRNKDDDLDTLTRCLWNTALCESFYPSLQHFEVGLRNSIHNAASFSFRTPLWFKQSFMCGKAKEDVEEAENFLKDQGKDEIDPNRMVAELKFGFWTRLFSRNYEQSLWNNKTFIIRTFPHAHKSLRIRSKLAQRVDRIRLFRNRIFHHEPILRFNLRQHHKEILETIIWIEPALGDANNIIDRFPSVIDLAYYDTLKLK